MSTIDPNKKVQKTRTEKEMRKALSNLINRTHTMTVPPQDYDDDIVIMDIIAELLEAREKLKTVEGEVEIEAEVEENKVRESDRGLTNGADASY